MKKHYGNYFKGIPNFKEYKMKLIMSNDLNELYEILNKIPAIFIA